MGLTIPRIQRETQAERVVLVPQDDGAVHVFFLEPGKVPGVDRSLEFLTFQVEPVFQIQIFSELFHLFAGQEVVGPLVDPIHVFAGFLQGVVIANQIPVGKDGFIAQVADPVDAHVLFFVLSGQTGRGDDGVSPVKLNHVPPFSPGKSPGLPGQSLRIVLGSIL